MEKLYLSNALLKIAGESMHTPHPPTLDPLLLDIERLSLYHVKLYAQFVYTRPYLFLSFSFHNS